MPEQLKKVYQALLDPKWEWGTIEIDGKQHIQITLFHPDHGTITSLIPRNVAISMAENLLRLARSI